ncbi:MAG: adenylate/guanylate cyclase domain-containing protein [Candidatus Aminicenantales bacterium]
MAKGVRRLAAVMFTDIVGYSARAQENEILALELLDEHRKILRPLFQKYLGKEIKTIGDGFLVEFSSAVKATECAVEIQKKIKERNAALPRERWVQVRIGLHLGDIVHKEGDIYGDGVNIASRIQPLAEPGGIWLSEEMVAQVRNKIKEPLISVGTFRLKNINEPRKLYRLALPGDTSRQSGKDGLRVQPRGTKSKRLMLSISLVLLIGFLGLAAYLIYSNLILQTPSRIQALAVLPLQNLNRDPDQEYFADGMTEALLTELSKIKALRVISRTSVMRYKQTTKSLPEIAKELRVDALLEGSALLSEERVRITTQLVQARPEKHLWAQEFEEDFKNILALQRRVAEAVARAIKVTLTPEDEVRLVPSAPVNPQAHKAYLQGLFFIHRFTEDAVRKGIALFEEAIGCDPTFAPAYAGLAEAYDILTSAGWLSPQQGWPAVKEWAEKSISLDSGLSMPHALIADFKFLVEWDFDGAGQAFLRSIELNPGNATAHQYYAIYLAALGRLQESLEEITKAVELDPLSLSINQSLGAIYRLNREYAKSLEQLKVTLSLDPYFAWTHWSLGEVYTLTGKFDKAIAAFDRALALSDSNMAYIAAGKAVAYAHWGKREEAKDILAHLKALAEQKYVSPFSLAIIHAALGDKDAAFSGLEKAYQEKSNYLVFLKVDPRLDPLRHDRRLEALQRKIGL